MTSRIGDYELIQPWPHPDGDEMYVAVPPARLGLAADTVALKVIRGLGDPKGVRRMVDELRIYAAVESPHLARVHDAGQDGDAFFYAMDYPQLGTLERPARELGPGERLRSVAGAARGAHALHEAGVVHRNISPGRVLLGADGAQLADLSLARFVSPGMVMSTMPAVGQLEYLDPALLMGSGASRSSDIWSLGAVLYFAASGGRSLYPEMPKDSPLGSVRQVIGRRIQVEGLPPEVTAVVRAAVSADPAEQPGTALELAVRIEALEMEDR